MGRFMGSLRRGACIGTMNRPLTPALSPSDGEREKHSAVKGSVETLRLMGSSFVLGDLLTGHELWVFGRARCARKRGRPRTPNARAKFVRPTADRTNSTKVTIKVTTKVHGKGEREFLRPSRSLILHVPEGLGIDDPMELQPSDYCLRTR